MKEKLLLLDTATIYYRAFYSLPETLTNHESIPINAIRGTLDRISTLVGQTNPDRIIAAWDTEWRPQWRVDLLPSYKAHRVEESLETEQEEGSESAVPDSLAIQIPIIEEVLTSLGIPVIGHEDFEADDVIGTYCEMHSGEIEVVTGDRDLFQLIDDAKRVSLRYTAKGEVKHLFESDIVNQYGIKPSQYVDYSIMRGDPSDGLPGVLGIGEKTAQFLIQEFENIDNVIAGAQAADLRIKPKVRLNIINSLDYIERAKQVVPVVRNINLPTVSDLNFERAPDSILHSIGESLNIRNSIKKMLASLA